MYFWLWIIIIIISLIFEFLSAIQLTSIFFALGGICALIANQLNASFIMQIIIFTIVSILSILVIKPIASRYLQGNIVKTNADRCIGQKAILLKEISLDTWGEIKVNNVLWHCTSVDNKPIEKGSLVKILAIEGVKLIVEKI